MSMKKLGLLTAMAGLAAMDSYSYGGGRNGLPEHVELRGNSSMTDEEKAKANGLKKFTYGSNHVFALNKRSADKKAKKLGYL